MPDTKFVDVYDTVTKKKQQIPEHWLHLDHPQFKRFTKTPRQRRADRGPSPAPEPVTHESPLEPVATDTESEG